MYQIYKNNVVKSTANDGELIEYYHFFASGLVLSSTNLNLESCLYAKNTMKAIIRKSIIFATRSPHMNFEFSTTAAILLKSPAGDLLQMQ